MPAIRLTILAGLMAATGAAATACHADTAPSGTTGTDLSQVEFAAECDGNGNALNVKPNTADARAAATEACQTADAAIDNAPWPSGWAPIDLSDIGATR